MTGGFENFATLFNLIYIQEKRQNTKQSEKFLFTAWIWFRDVYKLLM